MKRKILLCACVAALAFGLYADETTEAFKRLYKIAPSITQKHEILTALVDSSDASAAPFLADVLHELNTTDPSNFDVTQKDAYGKSLRLLCAALGSYRYEAAQDDLMKIASGSGDSLLRSEALIALGRLRSLKHIEGIVMMLESLNLKPTADVQYGEQLAYGCIMALAKMRDIRGWSATFFASNGWYGGRIKQVAAVSLPSIVDDPSPAVLAIIENEAMALRILAMKYEMESKAEKDNKLKACRLALKKGIDSRSAQASDIAAAKTLRKAAIENLVNLADSSAEAVDLYRAAWTTADLDEKLLLLAAFGANKGDAAAAALNEIIMDYNMKRLSEVSSEELERLAKAAIQNAGLTKNQKVLVGLATISANAKWSSGVLKAAEDARKAIQGK
jgi:hypothetical protein